MSEQRIRVKGHCLTLKELKADGKLKTTLRAYCGYGRNGFTLNKKEGDGCTPVGTFPLEFAFGTQKEADFARIIKPNKLSYRQITPTSYWSGEREDYNAWVETSQRQMPASEHLADYPVQYKYAVSIGYNTQNPTYGAGSAIFLHCKGPKGWPTAGCISIREEKMLELLKLLKPGAGIEIAG